MDEALSKGYRVWFVAVGDIVDEAVKGAEEVVRAA